MKVTIGRCTRFAVVSCALAALAVGAAGCGSRPSVVLEEGMTAVAVVETNTQALQAWADAGVKADALVHIDGLEDMTVFPPAFEETMKNASDHLRRKNSSVVDRITEWIENGGTVNLGYKAGFFDRVIWVIPTSGTLSDLSLDDFKRMLMKKGYPAEALGDLAVSGREIEGSIGGVPLTVTTLEDLMFSGERALLDIDLSYFTGTQHVDTTYAPGTASLIEFLRTLKGKRIPAVLVTVNRATRSKNAALDIRFFADIISEALADPSVIEDPLPDKYERMIRAEAALGDGDFGGAEEIYAGIVADYPSSAGLRFSHAFTLGFVDKGEECRSEMQEAVRLDPEYFDGFVQLAWVLGANGHIQPGEALLNARELQEKYSWIEMDYYWGLFYFRAGRYLDAQPRLVAVASRRPNDFSIRTVLLNIFEELGETNRMPLILKELIDIDRGRVERDMPWIFKKFGDISWDKHVDKVAAEMYRRYLAIVPDDEDASHMRSIIERVERADSISKANRE